MHDKTVYHSGRLYLIWGREALSVQEERKDHRANHTMGEGGLV